MRYFILITNTDRTLGQFYEKLKATFQVRWLSAENILIKEGEHYGWLKFEERGEQDYCPGELAAVPVAYRSFYVLQFDSIRFVKRVLRCITDDSLIWVDLDRPDEPIVPGPDLLARIEREPNWTMGVPTTTGD